jgi:hypothetical protein
MAFSVLNVVIHMPGFPRAKRKPPVAYGPTLGFLVRRAFRFFV